MNDTKSYLTANQGSFLRILINAGYPSITFLYPLILFMVERCWSVSQRRLESAVWLVASLTKDTQTEKDFPDSYSHLPLNITFALSILFAPWTASFRVQWRLHEIRQRSCAMDNTIHPFTSGNDNMLTCICFFLNKANGSEILVWRRPWTMHQTTNCL